MFISKFFNYWYLNTLKILLISKLSKLKSVELTDISALIVFFLPMRGEWGFLRMLNNCWDFEDIFFNYLNTLKFIANSHTDVRLRGTFSLGLEEKFLMLVSIIEYSFLFLLISILLMNKSNEEATEENNLLSL